MSVEGRPSSAALDARFVHGVARGVVFGLAAILLAGTGLMFCGVGAYFSLTPYLQPRSAALIVGGAGLVLSLVAALIGWMIVARSARRIARRVQSNALIVLTLQLLRFAAKHTSLVGLASAACAAYFVARSKTQN